MNVLITIGVVGSIGLSSYLFSKWTGRLLHVKELDIEENEGDKVDRWGR